MLKNLVTLVSLMDIIGGGSMEGILIQFSK